MEVVLKFEKAKYMIALFDLKIMNKEFGNWKKIILSETVFSTHLPPEPSNPTYILLYWACCAANIALLSIIQLERTQKEVCF